MNMKAWTCRIRGNRGLLSAAAWVAAAGMTAGAGAEGFAPRSLACAGGDWLAVIGAHSDKVLVVDCARGEVVRAYPVPGYKELCGVLISNSTAYVAAIRPQSAVVALDLGTGAVSKRFTFCGAIERPSAIWWSWNRKHIYIVLSGKRQVQDLCLHCGDLLPRNARREPVGVVLGGDGENMYIANHLPFVRAFPHNRNIPLAAEVTVANTDSGYDVTAIRLPEGSQGVRGIALSTDCRHIAVTHVYSRYKEPVRRIADGAMNLNVVSFIDPATCRWIGTVLLDERERGAANPWAVAFTSDDRYLLVTHAGTHDMSVIDWPALRQRLAAGPPPTGLFDDRNLAVLAGIRRRVALPVTGPRAMAVQGRVAYVAGYFSDSLARVDLREAEPAVRAISLSSTRQTPSNERLGERLFNDAAIFAQQRQSCASCHPEGRSNALCWDLSREGGPEVKNVRNTKSLIAAGVMPQLMWDGTGGDLNTALRAGIHPLPFAAPQSNQWVAIEAYLRALRPEFPFEDEQPLQMTWTVAPELKSQVRIIPSNLGQQLFEGQAGCVECHPPPNYTNGKKMDTGRGTGETCMVPSLAEVWRSAPYLHDAAAPTLMEVITDFNPDQKRGRTKDISKDDLWQLVRYVESLTRP